MGDGRPFRGPAPSLGKGADGMPAARLAVNYKPHMRLLRVPRVTYRLKGRLVPYDTEAGSWRFITLPKRQSQELRGMFGGLLSAGSLPVRATIGGTTWRTSVFWSKSGAYLLPVKAAVRKAESLADGATVQYGLDVGA